MKLLATATALLFAATVGTPCKPLPYPTPRPTLPPRTTPTVIPTHGIPTPIPPPVEVTQATEGKAVFTVDITSLTLPAPGATGQLDYFAFATLMWDKDDKTTPALELSVRGTKNELCSAKPCVDKLGIVARFSGDIKADGKQPDEHLHCGEGVNYSRRLPIPSRLFDVAVSWGPWGVSVESGGQSYLLKKGAPRVGFGEVFFALPEPRGIGWARSPWLLQLNGGSAALKSWQTLERGALAGCP